MDIGAPRNPNGMPGTVPVLSVRAGSGAEAAHLPSAPSTDTAARTQAWMCGAMAAMTSRPDQTDGRHWPAAFASPLGRGASATRRATRSVAPGLDTAVRDWEAAPELVEPTQAPRRSAWRMGRCMRGGWTRRYPSRLIVPSKSGGRIASGELVITPFLGQRLEHREPKMIRDMELG